MRNVGHTNVDPDAAEDAADALFRAVSVDRDHSIGYCGGYSKDGKTIYVDHDIDTEFKLGGKKVDVIKFLVVHECVEKALMDKYDLAYEEAHALATAAEDAVVRACGYDIGAYGKQWDDQIAKVGGRGEHPNPPDDLDPAPYEDSHDAEMMGAMDFPEEGVLSAIMAKRNDRNADPDEDY